MRSHRRSRPAFTLLEILVTVVVLGIAGALVIPAMGETGALRVQAALRTLVADITFIQSDAVAFQERRAIVFDVPNNSYRLLSVPGETLDPETNTLYDSGRPDGLYVVDFRTERYGNSRLDAADFGGNPWLIFDGMGGPVADPAGTTPSPGGSVRITGSNSTFVLQVEAFTGRVTVTRQDPTP